MKQIRSTATPDRVFRAPLYIEGGVTIVGNIDAGPVSAIGRSSSLTIEWSAVKRVAMIGASNLERLTELRYLIQQEINAIERRDSAMARRVASNMSKP